MERNTWNQFLMAPCHLLTLWSTCTRTFFGTSVDADEDNGSTSGDDPRINQDCSVVNSHSAHTIHATGAVLLLFPIAAMAVVSAILFNRRNRRRQPDKEMQVRSERDPPYDFSVQVPLEAEAVTEVNLALQQTVATAEPTKRLVNINTANESTLMMIPSIGRAKAKAIITYRETHGLFNAPESLMAVSGIGNKIFEKLAHFITID